MMTISVYKGTHRTGELSDEASMTQQHKSKTGTESIYTFLEESKNDDRSRSTFSLLEEVYEQHV